MRQVVLDQFPAFTCRFEGRCSWMYLDVKGLVTTGVGNLIDPMVAAIDLPWKKADGSLASTQEIRDEWTRIKSAQTYSNRGGFFFKNMAQLHLDNVDIDNLVRQRLMMNEVYLEKRYPNWENWPADAQMAIHSMSWAMGPAFQFPKFDACLAAGDFTGAAAECSISTAGNPGVAPRNAANKQLLLNAAEVVANGGDYDSLTY